VPLSPNWRLDSKGTGVRLVPHLEDPEQRHCTFEIVDKAKDHSPGTVMPSVFLSGYVVPFDSIPCLFWCVARGIWAP